ncbi:Transcriptional regulator, partial [Pseudomonas syringae pv. maculicola]
YRLPNGGLRLRSHNDAEYPDEVFSGEDIAREKIRILGWIFWWSTLNSRRNAMLLL